MTEREALNLALKALEADPLEMVADANGHMVFLKDKAITAIKEALADPSPNFNCKSVQARLATAWGYVKAQPEQEPVAYGMRDTMLGKGNRMMMVRLDNGQDGCTVPLYTTPPQRTWVGLTLDERIELAQDVDWPAGAYCEYAEKIESKLKEKNVICKN